LSNRGTVTQRVEALESRFGQERHEFSQSLDKISKPIAELRGALDKQGVRKKFEPYIAKIEHDYREMQETLLSAGMSGLNLAVVFHEVERGVRALHQFIVDGSDPSAAAGQASELMHLLDGFSTLLKRDSRQSHSARKLVDAARRFNHLRLRHHRVRLTCPILVSEKVGFELKFAFGLVLGALNNIIDNSLYWMRVRWPDLPPEPTLSPRQIYIGVSHDFEAGPALVIADTGPGFQDDPERMSRPFFTRKPTGMGLGLYYSNLAMELNGGQQSCATLFNDGVWFDPADHLFKMWYLGSYGNMISYAYSSDGKNWIKPSLPDAVIPGTNTVLQIGGQRDSDTIWMDLDDPNPPKFIVLWLYSHPPLNDRLQFAHNFPHPPK